jgi:hypothetical protein
MELHSAGVAEISGSLATAAPAAAIRLWQLQPDRNSRGSLQAVITHAVLRQLERHFAGAAILTDSSAMVPQVQPPRFQLQLRED